MYTLPPNLARVTKHNDFIHAGMPQLTLASVCVEGSAKGSGSSVDVIQHI